MEHASQRITKRPSTGSLGSQPRTADRPKISSSSTAPPNPRSSPNKSKTGSFFTTPPKRHLSANKSKTVSFFTVPPQRQLSANKPKTGSSSTPPPKPQLSAHKSKTGSSSTALPESQLSAHKPRIDSPSTAPRDDQVSANSPTTSLPPFIERINKAQIAADIVNLEQRNAMRDLLRLWNDKSTPNAVKDEQIKYLEAQRVAHEDMLSQYAGLLDRQNGIINQLNTKVQWEKTNVQNQLEEQKMDHNTRLNLLQQEYAQDIAKFQNQLEVQRKVYDIRHNLLQKEIDQAKAKNQGMAPPVGQGPASIVGTKDVLDPEIKQEKEE